MASIPRRRRRQSNLYRSLTARTLRQRCEVWRKHHGRSPFNRRLTWPSYFSAQAITNGVSRASETLRNLDWFEVTEIRGHLSDGAVEHYQVTMKIGFRYEGETIDR